MEPFSAGFALLQFGGMATVVGGLGYAMWTRRKAMSERMADPWRRAAGPLDLQVQAGGSLTTRWVRLVGEHRGRAVRGHFHIAGNLAYMEGVDAGHWMASGGAHQQPYGVTRVSVAVATALPRGLHLRPETAGSETLRYLGVQDVQLGDAALDSALHVSCDQPERLRALLATAPGERALQALARTPGLSLAEGAVRLDVEGECPERLGALLGSASRVAADLEAASRAGIEGLASAMGLVRRGDVVEGEREGLRFAACLTASGGRVTVGLPAAAPAGLAIVAADRPDPDGLPVALADPILGRLVTVRASEPVEAAAAFSGATTEAVLGVVRGHPGARLSDGEIVVPVPDAHDPEALRRALEDALALARSIRLG